MNPYRLVAKRLNVFEQLIQESYVSLFFGWILINIIFTLAYFALVHWAPEHGPQLPAGLTTGEQLYNSFYFSAVTATTVGYGDILPMGFSKLLTIIESSLALLVFTVLVGKLVGQRQDTTLHEVHRMTFEGVFYHIRHVLFIVRKDFDTLITKVDTHKQFTDHDWDTLGTAYLQAHSLIQEIPDLYNGHGYDLHNVDLNREKLLFEAVHRTLVRSSALIDAMDKALIDWRNHEASAKEYRRFIDMIDAMMPLWSERSPYHDEKEFDDIRHLSMQLHQQLKEKTRK